MRKIFLDAESLLSSFEMIHLRGGDDPGESKEDEDKTQPGGNCTSCKSCVSCQTCETCSSNKC